MFVFQCFYHCLVVSVSEIICQYPRIEESLTCLDSGDHPVFPVIIGRKPVAQEDGTGGTATTTFILLLLLFLLLFFYFYFYFTTPTTFYITHADNTPAHPGGNNSLEKENVQPVVAPHMRDTLLSTVQVWCTVLYRVVYRYSVQV